MKARIEFCEYMMNRIYKKLAENREYELLCYARLGIDLCLRQSDILALKWSQFDINNKVLRNVVLTKRSNQAGRGITVDYELTEEVVNTLLFWHSKTNDKINIFPKLEKSTCNQKIGELIGDNRFNGHELRSIGVALKAKNT